MRRLCRLRSSAEQFGFWMYIGDIFKSTDKEVEFILLEIMLQFFCCCRLGRGKVMAAVSREGQFCVVELWYPGLDGSSIIQIHSQLACNYCLGHLLTSDLVFLPNY